MATSRHVAATNYGGKTRCSDEYQKVFFYVPNLIGYTRVLLTAAAVYCMYHESPFWVFFLYGASEFLDVADGYYARKFNQCSKFGEVLDMVTDRCSTTCLLTYLAQIYPSAAIPFCFLISLDISSHYMQMYGSLMTGHTNHKVIDEAANPIMKAYYTDRRVLFLFCFGNEAFFLLLYLVHYLDGFLYYFLGLAMLCSLPISLIKNFINVVQLWEASKQLAELDISETASRKPSSSSKD